MVCQGGGGNKAGFGSRGREKPTLKYKTGRVLPSELPLVTVVHFLRSMLWTYVWIIVVLDACLSLPLFFLSSLPCLWKSWENVGGNQVNSSFLWESSFKLFACSFKYMLFRYEPSNCGGLSAVLYLAFVFLSNHNHCFGEPCHISHLVPICRVSLVLLCSLCYKIKGTGSFLKTSS